MSRYIQWILVLPLTLLLLVVASSPLWLPPLQPYLLNEEAAAEFVCPSEIGPAECTVLESVYRENPQEAEDLIVAIAAGPVPAPANEVEESSIRGDIDPTTLSEFIETRVRVGTFEEIDSLHAAEGRATIWELIADEEVTRVLRFDNNFLVSSGPDLRVYLSAHEAPRNRQELELLGLQHEVGVLKGNEGSQNYLLPPDLDITRFDSVVIFSAAYDRVYSSAALQQPVQ